MDKLAVSGKNNPRIGCENSMRKSKIDNEGKGDFDKRIKCLTSKSSCNNLWRYPWLVF